ncbi:PEGA domain-containing protein [Marinospirillum celere]|uniref:PEGA domain-containing protein n=1 Tax=Marinospirillum celere TaxID=1122252 RepID=A0A1I1ESB9_9GAMM|nr:PEGA domain-containing protein [Marinospirillum celere]SFB89981.1 PEGA domain-containing protein [Marinospirillum celere]
MRVFVKYLALMLLLLALPVSAEARKLLFADGYGETPAEARENALQELSQTVIAAVESDTESITRDDGIEFSSSLKNRIRVQSSSYFQGVRYSEPREENGSFRIQAQLDRNAVINTVEHLLRELRTDLNTLNRAQIEAIQDQATFLMAFSNYLPTNLDLDAGEVVSEAQEIRQLATRYLNFGRISFQPSPSDARIRIDGETLSAGEMKLLPPGNYTYEISADGYHTKQERVYISQGERRRLEVSLVPRRDGSIALRLENSDNQSLITEARRVFNRYSIQYSEQAPQVITLDVQQNFVTEISGMKIYNLQIAAEATVDGEVLLVRRGSQRNVAESQIDARLKAITRALVEAILTSEEAESFWQ